MRDLDSARRQVRRLGRRARDRWRRLERPGARPGRSAIDDVVVPGRLVRIENLAVALAAVAGLAVATEAPLMAVVVLALAPDLSLAGYLVDEQWGVRAYNAAHVYLWPALFAAAGWVAGAPVAVWIALAWTAHVGVDRALGLGLKYEGADFRDTHVQRLGGGRDGSGPGRGYRRRPRP